MKLATFSVGERSSYGIVRERGIVDAGARLGARLPDLRSVLAAGAIEALRALASANEDYALSEIRLLKPIVNPGKIFCVGVNYAGRNAEYKDGSALPKFPSLFIRFPDSLVAHGEPLVRPLESCQLDYEGEIAMVIGSPGRRIAEADAMQHIAGYTICNDGAIRDWIRHGKFNVTQGKNFEGSGSLGPWITTTITTTTTTCDEVAAGPLRVITRVNGEVRQDDTTDHMMFPMPFLISYVSRFCTLQPGDIIVTGTPTGAGVHFDPPRYLVPGDVVEVEVPGIGTLRNGVIDEERTRDES
jgi:2-keto-4-pentenoate hydratase/2-oxohepta-3-ene-1,7-dioic acid hydratase in catechol pathway